MKVTPNSVDVTLRTLATQSKAQSDYISAKLVKPNSLELGLTTLKMSDALDIYLETLRPANLSDAATITKLRELVAIAKDINAGDEDPTIEVMFSLTALVPADETTFLTTALGQRIASVIWVNNALVPQVFMTGVKFTPISDPAQDVLASIVSEVTLEYTFTLESVEIVGVNSEYSAPIYTEITTAVRTFALNPKNLSRLQKSAYKSEAVSILVDGESLLNKLVDNTF